MIICQTCGSQNLETSQYCDECGDSLNKYKPPQDISATPEVTKSRETIVPPSFKVANVTTVDGAANSENEQDQKENNADGNALSEGIGYLSIERGGSIGTEFPITAEESYIGRWDADNGVFPDVDLDTHDPEAKVSRKHARILKQEGKFFLEDIGSTNGTFINRGRRLIPGNPHPLNTGDEIIVGKTFLRFTIKQK
ncbi:MAG: FHA domain-containing protein [Pyrinomonadaceae bacterium]